MKRVRLIIAAFATTLFIASCSQEKLSYLSVTEAEGIIPGSWRVDYYGDTGGGNTDQFAGYTFTFMNDGTVTATLGQDSYNGTWLIQISKDEVYDQELVLTMDQMDILNHTWLITEMSAVRMDLLDNSGAEQIHFLKL